MPDPVEVAVKHMIFTPDNMHQRMLARIEELKTALRDVVMPAPDYPGQWLYGCATPRDAVFKAKALLAEGEASEDA